VTISNVFAFDIETVPDVEFGRRLHGLEGLTDKQVGYVMQTRQREQTGSEFLSLEQHRVVASPNPRKRTWCGASSTASSATARPW
jgi:predicted PolB exonuclease-like 3'-5' exonuclease